MNWTTQDLSGDKFSFSKRWATVGQVGGSSAVEPSYIGYVHRHLHQSEPPKPPTCRPVLLRNHIVGSRWTLVQHLLHRAIEIVFGPRRRTKVRREQKWDGTLRNVTLIALLAGTVFLSFTFSPRPAQAQQPDLTIAEMRVSLWPEYDDPRLLVIYRGRFDEPATFPRTVTFPIPASAQVNAAAYADETGGLLTAAWRTRQESDVQLISIDLPAPSFQLEFYYNAIRSANGGQNEVLPAIQGTTNKTFTFAFQAPYPIQSLRVDVQQPLTASDLRTEPPPTETGSDAAGFQYAIYDFGAVAPDQTIELSASYVKTSAETSVPPRQPNADLSTTGTQSPAIAAAPSRRPLLLGAAIALLGVAVAAGVLWIRRKPFPRPYRASSSAQATAAFCTQCGTRLRQGDRFCRQCGTAVRSTAWGAKGQRSRSRRGRRS